MGLFGGNGSEEKDFKRIDPRDVFTAMLKTASGSSVARSTGFQFFYKIIGFKGIKDGLGTSVIVANTAIAIAKLGLNVCVVDTSFLNPSQDVLLNTNYKDYDMKKRLDWLDMGFTNQTVLHQSKIDSKISVLSMQDRNIIDLLSTRDDASLVSLAFDQLQTKYDVILVDICSEPSAIATACLQQAQKVFQIWSNSPQCMTNIPMFLTNLTTLSCPLDKTRYVITSMTVDDIKTDWDSLFNKYKLKHLAHVGMSMDIARTVAIGKPLFEYASNSEDIQEFIDCVTDIACNILNIETEANKAKGTITSADIMSGKVNGTLAQKFAVEAQDYPEVARTLDQATAMVNKADAKQEQQAAMLAKNYTANAGQAGPAVPSVEEYSANMNDLDLFSGSDGVAETVTNESIEKKGFFRKKKRG